VRHPSSGDGEVASEVAQGGLVALWRLEIQSDPSEGAVGQAQPLSTQGRNPGAPWVQVIWPEPDRVPMGRSPVASGR